MRTPTARTTSRSTGCLRRFWESTFCPTALTKQWKSFALCIASNWAVPTLIDGALTDPKFSWSGRHLSKMNPKPIFSVLLELPHFLIRRAGQWWWELSILNWKSWWCLFSDPLVLCFITEEFENQPSYCCAAAVHVSLEQFPPLPSCNLPWWCWMHEFALVNPLLGQEDKRNKQVKCQLTTSPCIDHENAKLPMNDGSIIDTTFDNGQFCPIFVILASKLE